MPIYNLSNLHFTAQEKTDLTDALNVIRTILTAKSVNLTPEERKKFGSVAEKAKLRVQKVLDYHADSPHLASPQVNYTEMKSDWESRTFLAGLLGQLEEMSDLANNARIAHDYDAMKYASSDYEYTGFMRGSEDGAAWEAKYDALKPLFSTVGNDDENEGEGGGNGE